MKGDFPVGAFDQRVAEERADVLVYTSELTEGIEVTGRIRMRLQRSMPVEKGGRDLVCGWRHLPSVAVLPVLGQEWVIEGCRSHHQGVPDNPGPAELDEVGAARAATEYPSVLSCLTLLNWPKYRLTIQSFDFSG
ncbi:hypothetical protein ACIQVL_22085 [Streptomyces sp. NPDC090499]|uniref:hypothetical protein n=1 Tax=unclassified Streptomyces TaxID=2593676 RepID=UPI00380AC913